MNDHGLSVERRTPEPVNLVPGLGFFVRVAAEHRPAVGDDGPAALLGPWADELDVRLSHHRLAAAVAMGLLAFPPDPLAAGRKAPVTRWSQQKPRPEPVLRAEVARIARMPPTLWEVVSKDERGWTLREMIGLHPRRDPGAPVAVSNVGVTELLPVKAIFTRVVACPDGPRAVLSLGLPAVPPDALLVRWREEMIAIALEDYPEATLDVALRKAGHHLCLRAFQWRWLSACRPDHR